MPYLATHSALIAQNHRTCNKTYSQLFHISFSNEPASRSHFPRTHIFPTWIQTHGRNPQLRELWPRVTVLVIRMKRWPLRYVCDTQSVKVDGKFNFPPTDSTSKQWYNSRNSEIYFLITNWNLAIQFVYVFYYWASLLTCCFDRFDLPDQVWGACQTGITSNWHYRWEANRFLTTKKSLYWSGEWSVPGR